MSRLLRNLNVFAIRILLVSIILLFEVFFDYKCNNIVLIILFIVMVYDLLIDFLIQLRTRAFNYDEIILVIVSLLLFFTSQFRSSILVVLIYQVLNHLLGSFLKYANSTFVSDFLIDEDNYLLGNKRKISSDKISVGDSVVIEKGQVVPVDGVIKSGTSIFKSLFSRDNRKIKMTVDGKVFAGMVNLDKKVTIKASSSYQSSLINGFLSYMNKENKKTYKLESKVNKFIRNVTFLLIIISVFYVLFSYFYLDDFGVSSLNMILVLLVSTTFVSLRAFIPFIHYVTLYKLSISGIIVRDFDKLGCYNGSNLVILNKTGVATVGNFTITEVVGDTDIIFKYLNYAEYNRSDYIASVIRKYKQVEVDPKKISDYEFFENEGISLKYGRDTILVGNYYLFKENGIIVDVDSEDKIGTIIYVAVNKKEIGYIVISDMIKTSTTMEVADLRKNNYDVLVMSGDNSSITCAVTREIEANECYSSLLKSEREFFTDYVKEKYHSKSFYISDRGDDYFLEYNDFGITLNEEEINNISSDIAFIDDDISRVIDVSCISRQYKNSIRMFISIFIIIRFLLFVLGLCKVINVVVLVFGELILTIMMIVIVLRIVNDRKKG